MNLNKTTMIRLWKKGAVLMVGLAILNSIGMLMGLNMFSMISNPTSLLTNLALVVVISFVLFPILEGLMVEEINKRIKK